MPRWIVPTAWRLFALLALAAILAPMMGCASCGQACETIAEQHQVVGQTADGRTVRTRSYMEACWNPV